VEDQGKANELVEQANERYNGGDKLGAAPLYLEAVRAFPAYGSFGLVAGDTYREAGQHDEAVEAYQTCIAVAPDHDQAWHGLGQSYLALGRNDEAREAFGHAGVPFPLDARPGCLARLFGGG